MNEASVSGPWMSGMREVLPGAIVVKHRDASMIGLPDCSITYAKKIAWVEFKLWVPPVSWDGNVRYGRIWEDSPTQYALMKRFSDQATIAAYIVWVKKTLVEVKVLAGGKMGIDYPARFLTTKECVDWFAGLLKSL